jgi:hypothetical protein
VVEPFLSGGFRSPANGTAAQRLVERRHLTRTDQIFVQTRNRFGGRFKDRLGDIRFGDAND